MMVVALYRVHGSLLVEREDERYCTRLPCCDHVVTHAINAQVDTDFSNDDDVRAILLVHDTKPPFLSGKHVFSKQMKLVLPLKDPTSDMAIIAKNVRQAWLISWEMVGV